MTKIANLHNGVQIHFPDETPDAEMDKAVQRHLGGTDPAAISAFMKAVNSHTKTVMDVQAGVNKVQQEGQQKAVKDEQQAMMDGQRHSEHIQATRDLAQTFGNGIQALTGPLTAIAGNSEKIPELVMALNSLSSSVVEATTAIISALRAPRETHLINDAAGKPQGARSVIK